MPNDTQADLTERARLNYGEAIIKGHYTHEDYTKAVTLLERVSHEWGGDRSEVVPEAYRRVAAALQSEREAAAAEARRVLNLVIAQAGIPDPQEACRKIIATCKRALASAPTPQEEKR